MSNAESLAWDLEITEMENAHNKFMNSEKLDKIEQMFLNKYFELPVELRDFQKVGVS